MVRPSQAPGPQDQAPPEEYELVSSRRLVRRRLGVGFGILAVLAPVALTLAISTATKASVESTVSAAGYAALEDAKVKKVRLMMDGRVMTAEVPTGQPPEVVERTLESVPGVASVSVTRVFASAAEARACENIQAKLDRTTGGQRVRFAASGTEPTAEGRAALGRVAKLLKACGAVNVVVGGHTDSRTSNGSTISLKRARAMVGLLKRLGVAEERMEARGYGDQFPVREGDGPAARDANQRGSVVVKEF